MSQWGEFKIGDLFEITRPVSRSMMKYEDGDVPFIASGNFNNGVAGYCRPKDDEELDAGMCITVSPLDGSSFFQKEPFLGRGGAGSAILMLRNNNFSEMNGLFIASVIRNTLTKYSYADQLNSKKIANEVIMLPVDLGGDPDWDYMDVYMASIMEEAHSIAWGLAYKGLLKHRVDVSQWGEFKIGDLFEITRPVSRSMMKYEDGDVPFIASGNFNNGVAGYCRPKDDEELDAGMCITVSPLDGSSFFQKEPFLGRGGAGSAILMLRNNNFSEMNGLFIASVIRNTLTKYSYADQLNSKKIANEVIMLPVDLGGDPDWDYMDAYASRLVKEMHARADNLM
ncbi:restriction endonuclease subunit S [uncultured Rothia sp.]|uniref:restriction endonuclease subunit S n=1 Tax=uncultured Rothia sp. TaxID=316088 RepID=UPI0025D1844F|nr:restriction endonuclease subunit S [uncultured Rothia sp.]